jgi:Uma2 family endonuclease
VVTELRQISERGIEGPPALVVEILSPSNPEYERTVKAQRYAALGVPHYWIVDPEARTLECYRNEDGRFVLMVIGNDQDTLTHPDFPGLTIPLASLWPS